MQDITEVFQVYRKCRLGVWNDYIQPFVPDPEHGFININQALFAAFFLKRNGQYDLVEKKTNILVQPLQYTSCFFRDHEEHSWDISDTVCGDSLFVFIDFFDFANSWEPQEYQYILCCELMNVQRQYLFTFNADYKFYIDTQEYRLP